MTAEAYPQAKGMQISPDQGAFMGWLVGTLRARRAIEVGVFTGYSSIVTAQALGPEGRLVACDADPRPLQIAQRFWEKAGVRDRVRGGDHSAAVCFGTTFSDRRGDLAVPVTCPVHTPYALLHLMQVEVLVGPGKESLQALLDEPGHVGSYDFAFVDADKAGYPDYHEQLLQVGGWVSNAQGAGALQWN